MRRAAVVACVVVAVGGGCATRGSVRQAADDLRAVQAEIAALRGAQDELSRRLAETAGTARTAHAKTEQLQAALGVSAAEAERLVTRLHATDDAVKEVRDALAAHATHPAPIPAPEPPRPAPTSSAERAFGAGLAAFRNREYGQAILDFLDVVTKDASHELAPTAQYWIGEAYYLQHDHRQALAEFQRAIDWGTPNPKVADALLKAGLCYHHLRESARAQQAWRRVVRDFPASAAAEEARALLAGKGPAPPPPRQP